MNVIEKHIHEHFAKLAANEGADGAPMTNGASSELNLPSHPASQPLGPAFAKVNTVVPGSPAESAGLKAGDLIRNFGYVNNTNNDGLKRVGECVQGNEGVSLDDAYYFHQTDFLQQNVLVKVSRPSDGSDRRQELQLTLTPRRDWGGRGMLGCHILPY
jgi:26S proteasome non-ATPase regulatory subunit 9